MVKKKSKFLTLLFSVIPGAGQMYLGYMKRGTSLMLLFFGILFLIGVFRNSLPMFFLPVVWCYALFDAYNRNTGVEMPPCAPDDRWIFDLESLKKLGGRYGYTAGGLLVFAGLYLLAENVLSGLLAWIGFGSIVYRIIDALFFLLAAGGIAALGVWLIVSERNRRRREDDSLTQEDFKNEFMHRLYTEKSEEPGDPAGRV